MRVERQRHSFLQQLIGRITIERDPSQGMPELSWAFGYPFALMLMLVISVSLYVVFRARDWL